jgi:hypothetical protein
VRRFALLLLLAVAVPAAPAMAGGWATVELGDSVPAGLKAGKPWNVELIVKAHGITPVDGLAPSVRIMNDAGVVKTFPAKPAGKPGTYVTSVTFPSNGTWRTRIFDGYTDATPHRLPPIEVGQATGATVEAVKAPPAPAAVPPAAVVADEGGLPWPQIIAIAIVALAFMAAAILVARRPQRYLRPQ